MEEIRALYTHYTSAEPERIVPLSAAGSNRQYFRIFGKEGSLIAVVGTSAEENNAFITLSRVFTQAQLPVPVVLAVSSDGMVYLQEDLGDESLYAVIAQGRNAGGSYSEQEVKLLCQTIRELPRFQFSTATLQDAETLFSQCYPQREMDRTNIMFDLNYFKYCFLKLTGIEFNEYHLQQDFERLADHLLQEQGDTFLYRDFQSRNVMLKDGKPYFIDFQGGRRGPIYYDVASFLWQSSAQFSNPLRNLLIDEYLEALQPFCSMEKAAFMQQLHLFVLFRILQVLGAYGYRGLWEKKTYFIKNIPLALSNLQQEIFLGTCDAYPHLKAVALALIAQHEKEEQSRAEAAAKRAKVSAYLQNDKTYTPHGNSPSVGGGGGRTLIVHVYSFSFKKGIPQDDSGNGGGYVFDCRSTHNPGRYDEYKPLTGLDQPVIDFLEADGEILTFLDSVYHLVDFHVARFIERGFTHIQLSFGCTGGRHRSVYSAQHVAEHIHKKFPGVEIHVCHREQNIMQVLTPNS